MHHNSDPKKPMLLKPLVIIKGFHERCNQNNIFLHMALKSYPHRPQINCDVCFLEVLRW